MTTNVPVPVFGARGFVAPAEAAILAGVMLDMQAAFGGDLNPALETPQGQQASTTAAIVGNSNDTFLFLTQMMDPAYAFGRYQDALARIYFLTRIPSKPTVLQVNCSGLAGVIIPVNQLVKDQAGNFYGATQQATIPSSGSIVVQFAALVYGPTPVPGSVVIYQSIPNWDSATVISGVVGEATESRSAFEARRSQSVAKNSNGSLPAVRGAVLEVPGVVDAYATENDTNQAATIGGVLLAPNSLYVAAVGGNAQDIGNAIWSRKAPGCAYNGNTTVTVIDSNSDYTPPAPAYAVSFEIPAPLAVLFVVNIIDNGSVPANALALIQNAIINAFAGGGDGGPRQTIGSTVFAARYYAAVMALGPWAMNLISIKVGSLNTPGASFTASITGNTMTVSAVASGALAVGYTVIDQAGNVPPGTTITALGTGTGGTGTYILGSSLTVSTELMQTATPGLNDFPTNIDQEPTVVAPNIALVLH